MAYKPRKPNSMIYLWVTPFWGVMALLEYVTGDKSGHMAFDLSLATCFALSGFSSYLIERHNRQTAAAPVRLWLQALCNAGIVTIVGVFGVVVGLTDFQFLLFLLTGALLAAWSAYLYMTDRLRVIPKYYDQK